MTCQVQFPAGGFKRLEWKSQTGRKQATSSPQMYFRGSVWGLLLFPTFKLKVPNKICIQCRLDFTRRSCPTGPHPHLRMSPETGAHLSRTHCPLSYHLSHQLHLLSPQNSPEFETPRLEGRVEYIYTQTVQSQYFSHQALDKHQAATKFTVWP